jgi:hypothetical protein
VTFEPIFDFDFDQEFVYTHCMKEPAANNNFEVDHLSDDDP